jgi:hypothetical protein
MDDKTTKNINEQIANINKGASSLGIDVTLPTITADTINRPTRSAKITQPDIPEPAPIDTTDAEAGVESPYTQGLQDQATEAQTAADTSFESLMSEYLGGEGTTALTAKAEEEAGVTDIQSELNDINQQIRERKLAYAREIERLDENKAGRTASAVADKQNRATVLANRELADLSVIQQGVQGRFDSAKAIADRAVAIEYESQQRRLDALQLNYERNKDLFNKKEQRAFESAQKDREIKLQNERDDRQTISDISLEALRNGAPSSLAAQMRRATSVEEAIRIGGSYIGAYDRRINELQIEKLKNEVNAATTSTGKPLTEGQAKARIFGTRMYESGNIVSDLEDEFTGITSGVASWLPSYLKSEDRKKYEQAQRDFVNAVLRRESGAQIPPDEFDSAKKQYFVAPGDTPAVIKQKRTNRQIATKLFLQEGQYTEEDVSLLTQQIKDPLNLNIGAQSYDPLGITQ